VNANWSAKSPTEVGTLNACCQVENLIIEGVMMPMSLDGRLRLVALLMCLLFSSACTKQPCRELTAREDTLRRRAVNRVLPEFPADAQKDAASGVVVAQINIDDTGRLRGVQILQSPHPSITQATTAALKQWVFDFQSNKADVPECFNGKLTFYFVLEGGKAYVRDPKKFQST
jgi:TonB family protein